MIEPYALAGTVSAPPAEAVATKRKSRREGSAAKIVVTVSNLVVLPVHSIRGPAADGPVSSDLGKVGGDAIRRAFIGTLAARAQVYDQRTHKRFNGLPRA
jgi:hypothetical protein